MDALKVLRDALEGAQVELAGAEIALMEASARAAKAREETSRLEAAVAALSGEPPPAAPSAEKEQESQEITPIPSQNAPSDIQEMSPEEFDAYRKRKQRQKEKEAMENNPFAHIQCSGCGTKGSMSLQMVPAPSGVPIRMMICSGCGNQTIS